MEQNGNLYKKKTHRHTKVNFQVDLKNVLYDGLAGKCITST